MPGIEKGCVSIAAVQSIMRKVFKGKEQREEINEKEPESTNT